MNTLGNPALAVIWQGYNMAAGESLQALVNRIDNRRKRAVHHESRARHFANLAQKHKVKAHRWLVATAVILVLLVIITSILKAFGFIGVEATYLMALLITLMVLGGISASNRNKGMSKMNADNAGRDLALAQACIDDIPAFEEKLLEYDAFKGTFSHLKPLFESGLSEGGLKAKVRGWLTDAAEKVLSTERELQERIRMHGKLDPGVDAAKQKVEDNRRHYDEVRAEAIRLKLIPPEEDQNNFDRAAHRLSLAR